MNLDLKKIPAFFAPALNKLKKYSGFIIVLLILAAFAFIIVRIRYYANIEPTQAEIDTKLQDLKRVQINQEAIDKIEKLQSTNVDVKSLFENARDNPFAE